jgi:hypothetical protein
MRRSWKTPEIRALAFETVLKPLWRRRKEFAPGAVGSPLGLQIREELRLVKKLRRLDQPGRIAF